MFFKGSSFELGEACSVLYNSVPGLYPEGSVY